MEQLGSHWADLNTYLKPLVKIKFSWKSERISGTLHEELCTFVIISHSAVPRMGNAWDKIWTEIQNKNFVTIDKVGKSKHNKTLLTYNESKDRQHVSALFSIRPPSGLTWRTKEDSQCYTVHTRMYCVTLWFLFSSPNQTWRWPYRKKGWNMLSVFWLITR